MCTCPFTVICHSQWLKTQEKRMNAILKGYMSQITQTPKFKFFFYIKSLKYHLLNLGCPFTHHLFYATSTHTVYHDKINHMSGLCFVNCPSPENWNPLVVFPLRNEGIHFKICNCRWCLVIFLCWEEAASPYFCQLVVGLTLFTHSPFHLIKYQYQFMLCGSSESFHSPLNGDLEIGEETGEVTATGHPSTADSSAFLLVLSVSFFPSSACFLAGLESFAFPLTEYESRHSPE